MSTENNKLIIAGIEITDVCELVRIWDKFDFERDFEKLVIFCQSKCPEKASLLNTKGVNFFKEDIDRLRSLFCPPSNANYFFLKEHGKELKNQLSYRFLNIPKIENSFLRHINGIIHTDKNFFVFSNERCWILNSNQDDQYESLNDEETIRILNNSRIFYDQDNDPVFWIDGELKKRKLGKWKTVVPHANLPPIIESVYWENGTCCVLGRNHDENLLLIKISGNKRYEFDKDLNVLQAAHCGNETILISKVRNSCDYIVLSSSDDKTIFRKEENFTSCKMIKIYPFDNTIFLSFHDKLKFRFKERREWEDVDIVLDYVTKIDNQYIGIKGGSIYSSPRGDYWSKIGEIPRKCFHPIYFAKNEEQIIFSSQNAYEICQIKMTESE